MPFPKPPTKKQLERQVKELKAQLAGSYKYAHDKVGDAGERQMMASGVMIELTALGGREIINPIVIRDGLSPETIQAIRDDIIRSYKQAVSIKPKGVENV